ncbi:uncharacterized protein CIMG_10488 [Coccidioides immitis RS]|uniref:Uncharacterized protein n=1 Tax=Coccidioides immitis (strain RS) TaxID=246410 RepID=A0A0D8JTB7_COCIM|nr:uncharacterized protein CIMG_10488 [Coccidioides immitis RS]KJF60364.1 hypothetical protein CIMG_10488 [Coccidioides immitis RS]
MSEKRPLPDVSMFEMEQFLSWLDSIARMDGLDRFPQPELLAHYIKLARDVKHNYLELLNAAFSTDTIRCPKWIPIIFKLGQYGIAPRAFIQLAIEFPGLFNPMIVNAIAAPAKVPLQRGDVSLGLALQRLVGENQSRYVSCLTQVWGGTDPEAHFRHQCPDALAIHAEMQLAGFYDLRVERTPSFWFIGVSKKSCYLCDRFLAIHPNSLHTSACHQKLYLSWVPPPTGQ